MESASRPTPTLTTTSLTYSNYPIKKTTKDTTMNSPRCINIDWLEVYCLEPLDQPRDDNYFRRLGWQVETRPYGTRSYRQMFTLIGSDGEPFLEVRREPVGFFKDGSQQHQDPNGCHLRLTNRSCYLEHAAQLMQQFVDRYGFIFQRIAKIDLAYDFERFDSGDYPNAFLRRYIEGHYSKINQSNISARGRDQWDGRKWNSVSWGADRSPVVTRFYNKSKELLEVKDKPYIRQAWAECGLIDDVVTMYKRIDPDNPPRKSKVYDDKWYKPDIWRVEFSVRSSVKRWVTIDNELSPQGGKVSLRNTLDIYFTRSQLWQMFASLATHYFHFRYYNEGVSKYAAEDKMLFDFHSLSTFYKVEKLASSRPKSDIIERLIRAIEAYRRFHFDKATNKAAAILEDELRRLQAERMAVRPWDESETRLLRRLLAVRLSDPSKPFSFSFDVAQRMADIERTLWDCDLTEETNAAFPATESGYNSTHVGFSDVKS